jgi:hypothetical protein
MGATFKKIKIVFLALTLLSFQSPADASPENDRVYQFETLSWLKPSDNLDGVFSDYLDEQFSRYFSNQNRFLVKPLKGLNEVFGKSKAKYSELIQQNEILRKISQKYQVEGLIRSRVYKEGNTYRFVFEWVYAPKGDVVSQVEFRYLDEGKEEGIRGQTLALAIDKGLNELIQKLPFLGQVTGVDGQAITISVGHNLGLKSGQIVTLYSLQSVKRHPLLKTIEEWRWQPIGKAQVQQVDASLSFAKVIEMEPNATVTRFQKVREVMDAPTQASNAEKPFEKLAPKSGWVAGNLGIGSYSRESSAGTGSTARGGSGLLGNLGIDSQVWLNSKFIFQGTLGGSFFGYNPTDLSTGAAQSTSYSGTESLFRLAAGYALFPMKSVFDPIAWVHFGYRFQKISLPAESTNLVATSDLESLIIGVGGEFFVYNGWRGQLGMDLGLLRAAKSKNLGYGDVKSSTDLTINAGASYPLEENLYFRTVISIHAESFGFDGGQSVTQKLFSINPSIMYYF